MRKIICVIITFFLILSPPLQSEQVEDAKNKSIEIFSFFNLRLGSVDAVYENSNALDFPEGRAGSFSSQTLTLKGRPSGGFNTGVSFPLHKSFRLKLSVNYSRSLLRGENSPFLIHLEYISMPPDEYIPVEIIHDYSVEWVKTQGNLKTLAFLLNLQYTHALFNNITLSFSAGGGVYRIFGDFNPLGYSEFWLGGHDELISEDYLLMLKIPYSNIIGINVDAGISHHLSERFFIMANIAYHLCENLSVVPILDYALYYYTLDRVDQNKLSQIQNFLDFGPLEINPSFFCLSFGLAYRFSF